MTAYPSGAHLARYRRARNSPIARSLGAYFTPPSHVAGISSFLLRLDVNPALSRFALFSERYPRFFFLSFPSRYELSNRQSRFFSVPIREPSCDLSFYSPTIVPYTPLIRRGKSPDSSSLRSAANFSHPPACLRPVKSDKTAIFPGRPVVLLLLLCVHYRCPQHTRSSLTFPFR